MSESESDITDALSSESFSHGSLSGAEVIPHDVDDPSLMQLALQAEQAERSLQHPSGIPNSLQGIVYIDRTLAEQADALQLYVRDRIGVPTTFVGTHAWFLQAGTHEMQFFAKTN